MNLENFTQLGIELVRHQKEGGDISTHPGLASFQFLGSVLNFTNRLRALADEKTRERALVEFWPVVCDAVRNGDDSELAKAVARITAAA